jgi:hypothetical protein
MKIRVLSLVFLLFATPLTFAQSPSSRTRAAANRAWPSFIAAFRIAVKARDRNALRGMIATPFNTQVDGEFHTPEEVFRWLDLLDGEMWKTLQKEVRSGAKPEASINGGGPRRCTNGIFCFEFRGGRWGLSEQGENETGSD